MVTLKIEYGRAWDWFLRLIFREKKVKKKNAYQNLVDITKEYYAPAVQEQFEKQWLGIPYNTKHGIHRPKLGIEMPKAHAKIKAGYKEEKHDKDS